MEKKIKLYYNDDMDLLNAIDEIADALFEYGIKITLLEGGDGYEEIKIYKI